MTKSPVFGILLALALLTVPAAAEELQTLSPREIWPQATAFVRAGNLEAASAKVDELLQAGDILGISRFPAFADSAASLALQADQLGNRALSDWALEAAHKLDRNSPDVEFTTADLARRRSQWNLYFTSLARGFGKTFSNYRVRVLASSDLTLVLCAAFAAAAIAFTLLLLYRYARSAVHDFQELLAPRFSRGTTLVLAWAALVLPVFLWLGPGWLTLYWLVLFFGYASTRERAVIIVLLLGIATLPVILAWTSYRISGIDSPVIYAAVSDKEDAFNPEALRRLRELREAVPDEPVLALLMGNMEVQEANERAAAQHYRQAVQMDDRLAGAHLNLGVLYFLENDFQTATLEYERAWKLDPSLAIAHYNHAVASGELYKFDEQGRQLELAKQQDRSLVESLLERPPRQKVVMYELPVRAAWDVAERIARSGEAREIYGNHAVFDLDVTIPNPLTYAALAAIPIAFGILWFRRKNGTAGECVKCGRTFCPRCKASRESMKYCMQCIHIYLRRDGVSVDQKREKMQEVQEFQTAALRRKKILATFFPGGGQILDDATLRGFALLFLFTLFVAMACLIGRLAPLAAPALSMKESVRMAAVVLAVVMWLLASINVYRQKVAA